MSARPADRRPLREDLAALAARPRALWGIYVLKLLESVAYFAAYNVLAVYLGEELGYTDKQSGTIAGIWLTAVSLVTFMAGSVADAAGLRKALVASVLSCLAGRVLLAVSHERAIALTGLAVMSYGVGSMFPTMAAGVRKLTDDRTVSFGFSLYYVVMNVGALVAGPLVSMARSRFARPLSLRGLGLDATLSSGQVIYLFSSVITLLGLLVTLWLIRDPDERTTDTTSSTDAASADPAAPYRSPAATTAKRARSPLSILAEVAREGTFWRFLLFVSLLVLVRLIFQHAHLTWPRYTLREFGRDFPYATYWSINPLIIIALTPVVTALTRARSAFGVIVWGAFITTASVFFLAASTTVTASVLFIVTLSLGEALWSPRLYEFTTRVAPPGREGTYTGLAQIPMFVAKPVVGFVSGALLARYCPATGPRDSRTLWLIVGLTTLAGPVLIVLLRRVIVGGTRER
jgi:dipeptide/tripeptide permease